MGAREIRDHQKIEIKLDHIRKCIAVNFGCVAKKRFAKQKKSMSVAMCLRQSKPITQIGSELFLEMLV